MEAVGVKTILLCSQGFDNTISQDLPTTYVDDLWSKLTRRKYRQLEA